MPTLKLDLDRLVQDSIIDTTTKEHIETWHEAHHRGDTGRKFLQIFMTIGAVVAGFGLVLLVAANWANISDLTKTIIAIGTTVGLYILGYIFTYIRTDFSKTGEALTLLGALSYGASIFLLGQIYNIGGTFSESMLIWAIGVFPIAYTTKFVSLFVLAVSVLYGYTFAAMDDLGWYIDSFTAMLLVVALGYASLSIARAHTSPALKSFGATLSIFGALGVLGWAFAFTFSDFWNTSYYWVTPDTTPILVVIGVLLVVGIGHILYRAMILRDWQKYRDIPLFVGVIPLGLLALYAATYSSETNSMLSEVFPYVVAMNIVYLAAVGTAILNGISQDKTPLVNIGVAFFAVYLFGKYLAFVFDSKLDGGIIFLSGGIVCILIGWLAESFRRRILKEIS